MKFTPQRSTSAVYTKTHTAWHSAGPGTGDARHNFLKVNEGKIGLRREKLYIFLWRQLAFLEITKSSIFSEPLNLVFSTLSGISSERSYSSLSFSPRLPFKWHSCSRCLLSFLSHWVIYSPRKYFWAQLLRDNTFPRMPKLQRADKVYSSVLFAPPFKERPEVDLVKFLNFYRYWGWYETEYHRYDLGSPKSRKPDWWWTPPHDLQKRYLIIFRRVRLWILRELYRKITLA